MNYEYPISYLLDIGNRYRPQVEDAFEFVKATPSFGLNLGAFGFDSDDSDSALQAADVVSWSVRRKRTSQLKSGFEPLAGLFNEFHLEVEYKEEWMTLVADIARGKSATI